MRSNVIDLEARLIGETEKARRFDFGDDKPQWLPKSQHEWDEDDQTVTLPEWIAVERGLV